MPLTEKYQIDIFSIFVLIVSVIVLVFLIIAAIYFYNLMNLKPPTRSESTFLFWTSLILVFIIIAIGIYALIRLFTYKVYVFEEPNTSTISKTEIMTPKQTIPEGSIMMTTKQTIPLESTVKITPTPVMNITSEYLNSSQNLNYSEIPLNPSQKITLLNNLSTLGD